MGENTKIEWTSTIGPDGVSKPGHTFNPWRGCTHATVDGVAHPGCEHCYAEKQAKRNPGTLGQWGDGGTRVIASEKYWGLPETWNKKAEESGVRAKVFCASMADVFEAWPGAMFNHLNQKGFIGPDGDWEFTALDIENGKAVTLKKGWRPLTMADIRERLFLLIERTPWLDWIILTKRPGNVRSMWPGIGFPWAGYPGTLGKFLYLQNVWLLTSISDQRTTDELTPQLLTCGDLVPVLGLSAEPLLGEIDLSKFLSGIGWVIAGGESGPHARPMHKDWATSLRDQCKEAGTPFFFKQWGEFGPGSVAGAPSAAVLNNGRFAFPDTHEARKEIAKSQNWDWNQFNPQTMSRVGKHAAGRILDGATYSEYPQTKAV